MENKYYIKCGRCDRRIEGNEKLDVINEASKIGFIFVKESNRNRILCGRCRNDSLVIFSINEDDIQEE